MRAILIPIITGLLLVVATAARADAEAEAKAAFEDGKALFESGKFVEAADAFRRANELNPNWKIYYNIGQSEAAAKRYGLALDAFEKYLAGGGDDVAKARQTEVMDEVRRLREMVGVLEVRGREGDRIEVNGVDRGTLPDADRVKVGMGEVTLRVVRDGDEVLSRTVPVSGGETVVVEVDGAGESTGPVGPTGAATSDEDGKGKTLRTVGWITLGVGAAVLIGGAATGGAALSMNSDLKDQCGDGTCTTADKQGDVDTRDGLAVASSVLLPVGGAIAATGIILLIVGSAGREDAGTDGGEVSFVPTMGPGFTGAALTGRF